MIWVSEDRRRAVVGFSQQEARQGNHQSTTDPDTRPYKKSEGSGAYLGDDLMENRNGSLVDTMVTFADGRRNGTRPF